MTNFYICMIAPLEPVSITVHCHSANSQLFGSFHHPAGDFTPVGYQHLKSTSYGLNITLMQVSPLTLLIGVTEEFNRLGADSLWVP